jgi:NAD(P)-dependent dehydrogenase (short-subunit alcohol dehydrogenase family)
VDIKDKIIVITGAASGIGAAMADNFAGRGAKRVICADRDLAGAEAVARRTRGIAIACDVAKEADIVSVIEAVETEHGPIDLFVSNAGIFTGGGAEVADAEWQRIWDINVMAHIWAARHMVPRMLARGGGYLLNTASAAGLLSQIGGAPYAVTKHAAVAFAEWLAITHGREGLKMSVLCPQGVHTAMTAGFTDSVVAMDGMLSAEAVAEACAAAVEAEQFLILPHPEVADYFKNKAGNYERWIGGMQKLNAQFAG